METKRIDPAMVEQLKDENYVRAFGLMKQEEQKCFKDVGFCNCEIYYRVVNKAIWRNPSECVNQFYDEHTFRIKSDYQPPKPEREIEWLEVKPDISGNDIWVTRGRGYPVILLASVLHHKLWTGKAEYIIDGKPVIKPCLRDEEGRIPARVAFWKEQKE